MPPRATLREMLTAGVHLGHQTRYWNPSMAPYIFGERNKIHIINLEITQRLLDEAAAAIRELTAQGKITLIVGTKRAAQDIIRSKAEECGMPYVAQRWLGGTLTNFHTVSNSVKRLQDLRRMEEENLMARLSKKEILGLTREKIKLLRSLGGIEHMDRLPDALFIIDVGHEKIAVREAQRLNIPVIAVVDSNHSIEGIDYVIPGNDDAIRSIQLYMDVICKAVSEGRVDAEQTGMAEIKPRDLVRRKGSPRTTLRADGAGDHKPEAAAKAELAVEPKAEAKPTAGPADTSEPTAPKAVAAE